MTEQGIVIGDQAHTMPIAVDLASLSNRAVSLSTAAFEFTWVRSKATPALDLYVLNRLYDEA